MHFHVYMQSLFLRKSAQSLVQITFDYKVCITKKNKHQNKPIQFKRFSSKLQFLFIYYTNFIFYFSIIVYHKSIFSISTKVIINVKLVNHIVYTLIILQPKKYYIP